MIYKAEYKGEAKDLLANSEAKCKGKSKDCERNTNYNTKEKLRI